MEHPARRAELEKLLFTPKAMKRIYYELRGKPVPHDKVPFEVREFVSSLHRWRAEPSRIPIFAGEPVSKDLVNRLIDATPEQNWGDREMLIKLQESIIFQPKATDAKLSAGELR